MRPPDEALDEIQVWDRISQVLLGAALALPNRTSEPLPSENERGSDGRRLR